MARNMELLKLLFLISFGYFCNCAVIDEVEKPFTLEEFLKSEFVNVAWNATWISDKELFYKRKDTGDFILYNAETDTDEIFLEALKLADYEGASLTLSPENTFVLIKFNVVSIFRHSTTAQYAVYNVATKKIDIIAKNEQLHYCGWSPKGDSLVYVFKNNIYYIPTATEFAVERQLTDDGIPDVVYNGVPDWVYEEEVLGSGSALWFSPDAKYLAFAKFDDNDVPVFPYFKYGNPGTIDSQYPELISIRYPKVNHNNPKFEVKVINLEEETPTAITLDFLPTATSKSEDFVLNDITWATNENPVVYYTNRVQTRMTLKRCTVVDSKCVMEFEHGEDELRPDGWINVKTPIYGDDDKAPLLLMSTLQDNSKDYYPHIVEYGLRTGSEEPLTNGTRTVTRIIGWDKKNSVIYYESTSEKIHGQKHVYSIDINTRHDNCLTCTLKQPEGLCTYSTASFSKDFSYYALVCQGPGPTESYLYKGGKQVKVWSANEKIRAQLSRKLKPTIQRESLKLKDETGKEYTVRIMMILPPGLDKESDKKYPMIVDVYAGPDSNTIKDSFSTGFKDYIVTNREYIYTSIDGRGTGLNGDILMYSIFRKLGTIEIDDQIKTTKYLQDTYTFIDAERTAIWGWSYGGFAAALALVKDTKNVFKCGLSVAPVTNFIYYDSIYTERYMGLASADDNEVGYQNTDITSKVKELRNKNFFLIHGNADDNVHYQQAMLLARALEQEDVSFRSMSYPDENHNLNGVTPHLYHTIDSFWAEMFFEEESKGAASSLTVFYSLPIAVLSSYILQMLS